MIEKDTQYRSLASTYMCAHVQIPTQRCSHIQHTQGTYKGKCYCDLILHWAAKAQTDCPRLSSVGGKQGW